MDNLNDLRKKISDEECTMKFEDTMSQPVGESPGQHSFQEQHFMIINSTTGENCGFYVTGIWELENIENEVQEGQSLKEISKDLWNVLLGNNEEIKLNCPKLKINKINDFINTDFLSEIDLKAVFFDLFEEQEFEVVPYEPSQIEKDVKFLAETLMGILEPMKLPEGSEPNPGLATLMEIIKRYS